MLCLEVSEKKHLLKFSDPWLKDNNIEYSSVFCDDGVSGVRAGDENFDELVLSQPTE